MFVEEASFFHQSILDMVQALLKLVGDVGYFVLFHWCLYENRDVSLQRLPAVYSLIRNTNLQKNIGVTRLVLQLKKLEFRPRFEFAKNGIMHFFHRCTPMWYRFNAGTALRVITA